jgi:hypothetical protein
MSIVWWLFGLNQQEIHVAVDVDGLSLVRVFAMCYKVCLLSSNDRQGNRSAR